MSYRRAREFKKQATNYCIRFGHSLWSANQLQGVKHKLNVEALNARWLELYYDDCEQYRGLSNVARIVDSSVFAK